MPKLAHTLESLSITNVSEFFRACPPSSPFFPHLRRLRLDFPDELSTLAPEDHKEIARVLGHMPVLRDTFSSARLHDMYPLHALLAAAYPELNICSPLKMLPMLRELDDSIPPSCRRRVYRIQLSTYWRSAPVVMAEIARFPNLTTLDLEVSLSARDVTSINDQYGDQYSEVLRQSSIPDIYSAIPSFCRNRLTVLRLTLDPASVPLKVKESTLDLPNLIKFVIDFEGTTSQWHHACMERLLQKLCLSSVEECWIKVQDQDDLSYFDDLKDCVKRWPTLYTIHIRSRRSLQDVEESEKYRSLVRICKARQVCLDTPLA